MRATRVTVRPIVWILSLALTVAGLSALAVPARAVDTGQISGTVTGPDGQPVTNAYAWAYRWDPEDAYWSTVAGDYTDATGRYDIVGLPADTYRIRFADYSGNGLLAEYFDNASTVESATDVPVTAGASVAGKNAQLAAPGHITGSVTGPQGQAIEGIYVAARRWDPASGEWAAVSSGRTDSSGLYDLTALTTGTYRVSFRDSETVYAPEYWDNAASVESATDIDVIAGATTSQRNAQLSLAGTIAGTVTDTGGVPIAEVNVCAYWWDSAAQSWDCASSAQTAEDGSYVLAGLPPGTYQLAFDDHSNRDYVTEYWDDARTIETATDVTVAAGGTVTGKDAQLTERGRIAGTVTGPDHQPVGSLAVMAYQWDPESGYWRDVMFDHVDASGQFEIRGLEAGPYRIAYLDISNHGYALEYWDDADTVETATDIVVADGQTTGGKSAELALGGRITGTVTDAGGGTPCCTRINAYLRDGDVWTSVASGYANSGAYQIGGLPAGTYRLEFVDESDQDLVTEYWDNAASLETATDIVVTGGATVSGKNAQLSTTPPGSVVVNTALPAIAGTAQVGSSLTATAGTWSPSTGLTYSYRWLVGGTAVDGATAATYSPVVGDVAKTVQVEVTAVKEGHSPGTATSNATAAVAAAPQPPAPQVTNISVPTVTGAPVVGATVSATPGAWSPAGAGLTYQWFVAGGPVPRATGTSYQPVAGDVGKALSVRVTASAAGFVAASASSVPTTVVTGTLQASRKPTVTGKAKKKATLVASPGTWSIGDLTVTYQWFAGTTAIPKATSAKLKIAGRTAKAVIGKSISVRVTLTAPGYETVTATLKVRGKVKR
jgi:hypothetical protein